MHSLTAEVAKRNKTASGFVHWGATSQDVIDTAMVLQLGEAVPPLLKDLQKIVDAFARLAKRHRTSAMLGRTLLQPATPLALGRKSHQLLTERTKVMDAKLLDGLEKIGFKLAYGDDGTGWQYLYLTRGGGYYFNVGCSDLLVDGKIGLVQFADIERFTAEGALMRSGRTIEADLIVLATGYKGQEELVTKLFGAEVTRRVGPIWGFGDGQELRNMFSVTPQRLAAFPEPVADSAGIPEEAARRVLVAPFNDLGAVAPLSIGDLGGQIELGDAGLDQRKDLGEGRIGDLDSTADLHDLARVLHRGQTLDGVDLRKELHAGEHLLERLILRIDHRVAVEPDA